MDPLVSAALQAWSPNLFTVGAIFLLAFLYWRGRREWQADNTETLCFLGGLGALLIALESPLDALDGLFLSAHMTQHLLLLMVAPPLLLLGKPLVPILRGLPRAFVKEGIAPFLTYAPLRQIERVLTAMPISWLIFALSTLLWHVPRFYELALRSPAFHNLQHASFFWTGMLFWIPVIPQTPARRRWPEWAIIPYLLFADILNTALSAFFIFSGRVLYPAYQALQASGIRAQDDQALAGAIMWVPGSLIYLFPAVVFAMRMVNPTGMQHGTKPVHIRKRPARVQVWTKRLPRIRSAAQIAMLCIALLVIWDGLAGPQTAPLNLAGVLPWIHWRAISVIALLVVGNLFCMACPFVLVRDAVARKFLPARLRWPRALRNKWLPGGLLLLYLWAYEALGLWNSPSTTAWLICSYFLAAVVIDGLFRGASFCKYVCPIGQFHFVTSLVSPREVKIKSQAACEACRTHDCIRGNGQARGCELYLFQPKKESSLDCTFCMDCVKACPHDNVALLPVFPGQTLLNDKHRSSLGLLSKRSDYAALALLLTFGGFVNAAGMTAPVMTAEHRWHSHWGPHGMALAVAVFTFCAALLLPLAVVSLCGLSNKLLRTKEAVMPLVRRFAFTLVPLGVAMWAAHLTYHLGTSYSAIVPAAGRFVGAQVSTLPANVPAWLTPVQISLLDAGVLLTLYLGWRLARQYMTGAPRSIAMWLPWALTSIGLYALGIWIVFQPMAMRGMM